MSQSKRVIPGEVISLSIILLVAALLRILFLGTIPNGFFCDEASNGYDSYSILQTLRDQHGNFLPLFARALDDYRPSMYIYLTVPFIKIFGLNEFATRLPAAVIGTLTVLALYYLAKEIFNNKVALICAFLLAISPWHIQFSRIAFEAILIPLLFTLGILFFVKSFKQSNYIILSFLFFALSLHTYQAARVFVPLFLLGIVVIYRKHLWKIRKQTLIAGILFLLIFIPLFSFWISPEGMARAKGTGVETNPLIIFQYYLSYFNPKFLFFKGDPIDRHSPAGIGELYYFEVITVLVGLFYIVKENRPEKFILLFWLFLYPIPAALTTQEHALRAIVGVTIFAILSGYGVSKLIDLLDSKRKILLVTSILILVASLGILGKRYFLDYPKYTTREWEYGMREAITYADKSNYDCIVVSNQIYLKKCGSIHVFIPFYTQYPPQEYQQSPIDPVRRKQLFLGEGNYTIGKYNILSIPEQKQLNKKCLFILQSDEVKATTARGYQWKEVHTVKDIRGIEYIKLLEVKNGSI
ncbi:glycosyltransferase family 39 protein [Anabaena sphaerica FACHB-251]|uniref:Glycosyltransferase family 39 protein n=1 Tax=Anabaena sphaerica FACHB-251 TaxID=2692883 RepID=A0A927A1J5_9NOST|nr:glycosyltransferase family 39 protein [Anabaena sphaerica]MBD2296197.1 glycosyltransferase family 39 protein [Anabaena sphaerica FACHB-251]